jgi:hypothetical protein
MPVRQRAEVQAVLLREGRPLVQGPDGELAHELPIGPELAEILQSPRTSRSTTPSGPILLEGNRGCVV